MQTAFTNALLDGGRCFAPIVWAHLPVLVNSVVEPEWWTNAATCRRLALDLMGATGATAMPVDVLHPELCRALFAGEDKEEAAEDVLEQSAVRAALEVMRQLVSTLPVGVLAVLPDIGYLGEAVGTDGADDVVCDLARGVMPLGVAGVVVIDSTGSGAAVRRVVRLAENFNCPVLLLTAGSEGTPGAWRVERAGAPGVVTLDSSAPTGVLITPGDVSAGWNLSEVAEFGRQSGPSA